MNLEEIKLLLQDLNCGINKLTSSEVDYVIELIKDDIERREYPYGR